ncbi:MAG: Hint domain-containing protein [Rhodobacteraceae bacterium]|nr:Hint domain-containing protein [Paracoccaceae bacterium]
MPFFASGTMITTLAGEKPVESLSEGDRVITRDNGLQTVRAAARRDFDYGQLALVPHLAPLIVTIGAIDRHLPERDLLVSPNMRLLVSDRQFVLTKGQREALIPVKNLSDGRMVRPCSVLGVSYVQILFDRHQVVLANGIWAEAFCPQDKSLGAVGNAQRIEIEDILAQGVLPKSMGPHGKTPVGLSSGSPASV